MPDGICSFASVITPLRAYELHVYGFHPVRYPHLSVTVLARDESEARAIADVYLDEVMNEHDDANSYRLESSIGCELKVREEVSLLPPA
jgi:hypothetical protein